MQIGVLLGGIGVEREVSIRTGQAVARALREKGHQVHEIDVAADADLTLRRYAIEVAFIALHGSFGEDGCIQGLLELRGIPYTGSDLLASALAMDKLRSKELFELRGVSTPAYRCVRDLDALEALPKTLPGPYFVKPRRGGSSVGAGPATTLEELRTRFHAAQALDPDVLVEELIEGHEIHVGILDGRALGAVEVVAAGRFYDYEAKYQTATTQYLLPVPLEESVYARALAVAEEANRSVGAIGATRIDLRVSRAGVPYVLEVNTVPGMTETSLLPKIAAHAGIPFPELCELIVARARLHNPAAPSASSSS